MTTNKYMKKFSLRALTDAGQLATGKDAAIRTHTLKRTLIVDAVITDTSHTFVYVCMFILTLQWPAISRIPSKHWFPVHPGGHSHVSGAMHLPGSLHSVHTARVRYDQYHASCCCYQIWAMQLTNGHIEFRLPDIPSSKWTVCGR